MKMTWMPVRNAHDDTDDTDDDDTDDDTETLMMTMRCLQEKQFGARQRCQPEPTDLGRCVVVHNM